MAAPPKPQLGTPAGVIRHIRSLGDPAVAQHSQRFFKTGPGQYGEGDQFLGVRVPQLRKVAKAAHGLTLSDMLELLRSPWHEVRLTAVIMMAEAYHRGNAQDRTEIFDAYLEHSKYLNNWDVVDSSAHKIVGPHLEGKSQKRLTQLARSESLWERRIAMISTLHEIKLGQFKSALAVAKILLRDDHDLIHKAVGWMLREIGQRDESVERQFLDQHAAQMPRTALRYAIEKFSPEVRRHYMSQ